MTMIEYKDGQNTAIIYIVTHIKTNQTKLIKYNSHEVDEQPLPILKSEIIYSIRSIKMVIHLVLTMCQVK